MSKAADMAKVSAKGGFHLLWGLAVSTIISAVGTIFIARLLGNDLYGLYGVVLTGPTLIATFRDWGVNSAMVRFAAQYRAEGRENEIRSVIVSGLIFEIALGVALTAVSFLLSGFLATYFNRPEIAPLIQIASITILAGALINATTAAFTGIERMELNSITLIIQSATKTAVIITLVIFGLGTAGATIGHVTGMLMAGLIGTLLMWIIYKNLPKPLTHKLEVKAYLATMIKYGLPISLAAVISGFLTQFYATLLPIHYVDNIMIGNYHVAANFVVLISFFSTPVATMMFPAFSKLDPQKDKAALRNVFQFSVKYASLLVVPVAALIMCISEPAVSTLFGTSYDSAPLFLALLAVSYMFTAFGNLSNANLLNSQGKTGYVLKLTLLTAAIGFPMGYLLIMNFGVVGLIVSSLTSGIPSLIIGLRYTKKTYDVSVDWRSSSKILLSAATAAALTYLLVAQLGFASWIRLVIGALFFSVVFVAAALLMRTIDKSDIYNLREMTSNLGFVSNLLRRVLTLLEKVMNKLRL